MLYSINRGNTGRTPGCQKEIVHLVSTVEIALGFHRDWAFSNGNAGAYLTDFFSKVEDLANLDWDIINSTSWGGARGEVRGSRIFGCGFFPWEGIKAIGCYNVRMAQQVRKLLMGRNDVPMIKVQQDWYYL